jgi:hypothetical protein
LCNISATRRKYNTKPVDIRADFGYTTSTIKERLMPQRLPVIKARSTSPDYSLLHGTNLVAVGLSHLIAARFRLNESDLLVALLSNGFATLGPYIFTLA